MRVDCGRYRQINQDCDFLRGLEDFFSELDTEETLGIDFEVGVEEFPYKDGFVAVKEDFYATFSIQVSSSDGIYFPNIDVEISKPYLNEKYGVTQYDQNLVDRVHEYLSSTPLYDCIRDTILLEASKVEENLGDYGKLVHLTGSRRNKLVYYVNMRGDFGDIVNRLLAETKQRRYDM